ncbi:hypothetical protein [Hydrogenivirga sp. 128-5-R1-1]|uniref:hypothetical protein n=1 Tax=Hydrogenivirga sp. 128-5-R1-1 TaxID=392423 RepID=UPI00030AC154|nr:hypothetical protein [Hydrogenivirga sp. 128-5-R1-1]
MGLAVDEILGVVFKNLGGSVRTLYYSIGEVEENLVVRSLFRGSPSLSFNIKVELPPYHGTSFCFVHSGIQKFSILPHRFIKVGVGSLMGSNVSSPNRSLYPLKQSLKTSLGAENPEIGRTSGYPTFKTGNSFGRRKLDEFYEILNMLKLSLLNRPLELFVRGKESFEANVEEEPEDTRKSLLFFGGYYPQVNCEGNIGEHHKVFTSEKLSKEEEKATEEWNRFNALMINPGTQKGKMPFLTRKRGEQTPRMFRRGKVLIHSLPDRYGRPENFKYVKLPSDVGKDPSGRIIGDVLSDVGVNLIWSGGDELSHRLPFIHAERPELKAVKGDPFILLRFQPGGRHGNEEGEKV